METKEVEIREGMMVVVMVDVKVAVAMEVGVMVMLQYILPANYRFQSGNTL